MSIRVRIPTLLRSYTGGAETVEGNGATVLAVLQDLEHRYPGIAERICSPDGGLRHFVNIFVNRDDTRSLNHLETTLNDGDEVTILPAIAGGCNGTSN